MMVENASEVHRRLETYPQAKELVGSVNRSGVQSHGMGSLGFGKFIRVPRFPSFPMSSYVECKAIECLIFHRERFCVV